MAILSMYELTADQLDTLTPDELDTLLLYPSYPTEVISDNPIIYWRLDETSGTTAGDYSGNGHLGTYTGTYTQNVTSLVLTDTLDKAISTNGSAGGIASTSYIFNNSTVTLECWTKIIGLPSTTKAVLCGCVDNGTTETDKVLYITSTGTFGFFIYDGLSHFLESPLTYNDGRAHHVVGTYNGTTIRLYIDGSEVANAGPFSASYTSYSNPNIKIGYSTITGYSTPNAVIDDFSLYSTALSAARVLAHYLAAGYTLGTPSSGSIPLYTKGYDVLNKGLNLYVRGLDTTNKNLNLYTFGVSGYITKSLNLYTRGLPFPASGHINLYTSGSGIFGSNSSLNLYVNAEGIHYNSSLPLMTWGSSQSGQGLVYYDYDPINLYIKGDGTTDGFIPNNSFMNLFLKVSPGLSGNISLYERGLNQFSQGVCLYSYGVSGYLNNGLNLYTRSNDAYTSGVNLFARGFIT